MGSKLKLYVASLTFRNCVALSSEVVSCTHAQLSGNIASDYLICIYELLLPTNLTAFHCQMIVMHMIEVFNGHMMKAFKL